jgi:hypothetical protein
MMEKKGYTVISRSRKLVRTMYIEEDNIKKDLQEIRWEGTKWINFFLDRIKWLVVAE